MSTCISISSLCGESKTSVDIYDLTDENNIICCDNCESILICRKAWGFLYGKDNK